jgi:GNAT superfamily N-acetyltransferase
MQYADDDRRASEVEGELLRAGIVEVLDVDSEDDVARWAACDLSSMVEGSFQVTLDPFRLAKDSYQSWLDRLGESYDAPIFVRDVGYTRFLWLLDREERVGTLALPTTSVGRFDLQLWSIYVHPSHRRHGITTRMLQACYDASLRAGFRGICLSTHWPWQRSLRYYLNRGLWVTGWGRSIDLASPRDIPAYVIDEQPDRISLTLRNNAAPWWTATRDGARVELVEDRSISAKYDRLIGHATIAVVLATRGWPLVRSAAHWERRQLSSEIGEMEGLAYKIQIFEAVARRQGWVLQTPRIPGLEYPGLDQL